MCSKIMDYPAPDYPKRIIMNVVRSAFWLDISLNDKVFCWLHYPEIQVKKRAVVIVGALGPEYSHCFRAIRLLADELAKSGYATVRYDPIGMGNSTGSLEEDATWGKWIHTPGRLVSLLNDMGFNDVVLIGFRSGSLILSEYAKSTSIETAIFVYPYLHGRAYYRDMQMLDLGLNLASSQAGSAIIEGGGYPLTENSKIALGEINLTSQSFSGLADALVISDGETTVNSKFVQALMNANVNVELLCLEGQVAMTRPAAVSVVPELVINSICDWVSKTDEWPGSRTDFVPELCEQLSTPQYVETLFKLENERALFGVLTSPAKGVAETIVVFSNAGSGHHAGPNRLHVDAARALAENGVASLRIDLSNLGDSVRVYKKDQYHPYPENAAEDIDNVLSYFQRSSNYKNIVLCGLCSGAHNVFHAALRGSTAHLTKIILINPLTLYWTPDQSIMAPEANKAEIDEVYYQEQAYDYKKWLALLTNPAKIIQIILFVWQLLRRKLRHLLSQFYEVLGVASLDRINTDLLQLLEAGVKIALITSKNDPGERIVLSGASRAVNRHRKKGDLTCVVINNADHTFSSRHSRKNLIKELIKTINQPEE